MKDEHEMSPAELERTTGVRSLKHGASKVEIDEWFVATMIVLCTMAAREKSQSDEEVLESIREAIGEDRYPILERHLQAA